MRKVIPLALFILIFFIGVSENNNVKAEGNSNVEKWIISAMQNCYKFLNFKSLGMSERVVECWNSSRPMKAI